MSSVCRQDELNFVAESLCADSPPLREASVWRVHLQNQSNRNGFYKEVCKSAREGTLDAPEKLDTHVKALFSSLVGRLKSGFFMIYIDEAHRLGPEAATIKRQGGESKEDDLNSQQDATNKQGGTSSYQHQDMIRQIMSAMASIVHHEGHVLVLASTSPQLYKSARAPRKSQPQYADRWELLPITSLPQVWTSFPFKIFSTAPLQGLSGWTPSHARSLKASANLGRPL